MTEVTFYLSDATDSAIRQSLAWRLALKAIRQDRQVFIHCPNASAASALDEQFWHTPATGFLPHCLVGEGKAPVLIGCGNPGDCHDVLINLDLQVPDIVSRFQRVAELVSGDAEQRQQGRERFRYYQSRGFPLRTHTL